MTNFRSQNVTTLSKNEIRSQNVVADEDTISTLDDSIDRSGDSGKAAEGT